MKACGVHYLTAIIGFVVIEGCASSPQPPRVVIDSTAVAKTAVFTERVRGTVKTIQKGDFHSNPGDEIAVVGQMDVWLLSADNYELVEKYEIAEDTILGLTPRLVDVNGDGRYEIMKGGGGYGDVGVIDPQGRTIWKFQPDPDLPPMRMVPADLDTDSSLEFYVADYTGLYRLNSDGSVEWKIPP